MINVGEILTLDDNNKYVVVYTTNIDSKDYAYLINQDDLSKTMFCEYIDSHLEEVEDEETISKILKKFMESKKD